LNSRKFLLKITEKWPVKVLSVAAALILSVFHRMNTLESRFFSVPLRIEASETLVPANSYIHVAKISMRGEANSILPILEEDIEAFIDLERYTNEGIYRVPVQFRKKGSALGVEPLEISVEPTEISLRLERRASRNIPVVPVFRGNVAQGFEMTGQSITPDTVQAEGPRSNIDSLYEFHTGTIDLEGRYNDFSVIVNIVNNDPLVVVHGNRMIEYSGSIRRIERDAQTYVYTNNDADEDEGAGEQ